MAAFLDVCRFNPTAGGTTDWTVSTAVTGYQTPASAGAVNGTVYRYRAESADLSQWEIGYGAYTVSTTTLARTTILYNSSGSTSKISFSAAPQIAVVALKEDLISVEEANSFTTTQQAQARSNINADFPSGTLMLFQQTSAPTGWTKQTTHNDKVLRVVSGTPSYGGTNAFSTVNAQTVVGSTTLSAATIPAVNIRGTSNSYPVTGAGVGVQSGSSGGGQDNSVQASASGGAHNHSITMSIQYVDLIIAQKN